MGKRCPETRGAAYLHKHLGSGHGLGVFVGEAENRHGLPVSGKLQCQLLLHQLFNDLKVKSSGGGVRFCVYRMY